MLRKSLSFSGPSRPGWHGQLVGASSGNWRFWSPARVCTVPCLGASLSHQWFPLSLPLSWNATKICPEVRIKKKKTQSKNSMKYVLFPLRIWKRCGHAAALLLTMGALYVPGPRNLYVHIIAETARGIRAPTLGPDCCVEASAYPFWAMRDLGRLLNFFNPQIKKKTVKCCNNNWKYLH